MLHVQVSQGVCLWPPVWLSAHLCHNQFCVALVPAAWQPLYEKSFKPLRTSLLVNCFQGATNEEVYAQFAKDADRSHVTVSFQFLGSNH